MDLGKILKEVVVKLNKERCNTHGANTTAKFISRRKTIEHSGTYCCEAFEEKIQDKTAEHIESVTTAQLNDDINNMLKRL